MQGVDDPKRNEGFFPKTFRCLSSFNASSCTSFLIVAASCSRSPSFTTFAISAACLEPFDMVRVSRVIEGQSVLARSDTVTLTSSRSIDHWTSVRFTYTSLADAGKLVDRENEAQAIPLPLIMGFLSDNVILGQNSPPFPRHHRHSERCPSDVSPAAIEMASTYAAESKIRAGTDGVADIGQQTRVSLGNTHG